jgi:hypothetical protein
MPDSPVTAHPNEYHLYLETVSRMWPPKEQAYLAHYLLSFNGNDRNQLMASSNSTKEYVQFFIREVVKVREEFSPDETHRKLQDKLPANLKGNLQKQESITENQGDHLMRAKRKGK